MQDIDNANSVLYLCVMKNKDEFARFKFWFNKQKIRTFLNAKRDHVQLAIDADLIDYDLDEAAYEWAIMHLIKELGEEALRYKMARNHAQFDKKMRLKDKLVFAYKNGLDLPKELDGLVRDYHLRALLTLSKPLHTLYNTSGWEGWDGEYV